jgi:hypothetical protein
VKGINENIPVVLSESELRIPVFALVLRFLHLEFNV